jgi:hypothetical protein
MGSLPLLLVSVTDADEAVIALEAGADVLDVKRPEEGSLGAPFPDVLRAVVARRDAHAAMTGMPGMPGMPGAGVPVIGAAGAGPPRASRVRVSAALGDAPDLPGSFALAAAGAAACGADDVKVGLRGPCREAEAIDFLRAVAGGARSGSPPPRLIAAAYADAVDLGALDPLLLPRVAARAGAYGCLIDTLRKDGRTLFDHLPAGALARFVAGCREAGLVCGLAGSLTAGHLPLLLELGPDIIGFRGAICSGGRHGRIDPERLRALRALLRPDGGVPRLPSAAP